MLKRAYNMLPLPIKFIYRNALRKSARIVTAWLRGADVWEPDSRVRIGKYTYGIRRSTIPILRDDTRIDVGKYCSIAPGVAFIIGRHFVENVSTYPFRAFFAEGGRPSLEALPPEFITIGNDVWIGSHALIVANVTIGDGAVIAAGSVVVKDIPPYAVVGGIPAKIIKMRHDAERVRNLLDIAWWDWPEERIRANLDGFYGDPDEFIRKHAVK